MIPTLFRWLGLLLLGAALILQSVGSALFDGGQGSRAGASLVWLVGPIIGWMVGFSFALRYPSTRQSMLLEYIWVIVLGLHSIRAGLLGGGGEAVISFLSWGAWFGAYLWLASGSPMRAWMRHAVCVVLLVIGVALSCGVMFEAATGTALIKETTIGEDVVRRYGLSQSVVVGGIQTGCGLLAGMYLSVHSKSWSARIVLTALAAIQWIGLFLSTARAPILLTLVAVVVVLTVGLLRRNAALQLQAGLLAVMAIGTVPFIIREGWLNVGVLDYLESSLTYGDLSNQVRVERMQATAREATRDAESVLLGIGAGETVVLPKYRGHETLTSESSSLKMLLETGLFGFLAFYGTLTVVVIRALRVQIRLGVDRKQWRAPAMAHLCLLAMVCMIALETLFHDMLTTWVIAGVYWCTLGALEGANAELLEEDAPGSRPAVTPKWRPRQSVPPATVPALGSGTGIPASPRAFS